MFGAKSFFTNEAREHSIRSKNFSTILEIKQTDFLNVIKSNQQDYEEYVMTRDSIKLYSSSNLINETCLSCGKSTHILNICPFVNFIPVPYFLIKKIQSSKLQNRNSEFKRKKKRRFHALNDNNQILNEILLLESSIFPEADDDDDNDDNNGIRDSSSSFRSVSSNKLYEDDKKVGFPSKQYFLEDAKEIVEISEKIKLPNQLKQEEVICKQSTFEEKDEEFFLNKGQNLRNADFKRKSQRNRSIIKEKLLLRISKGQIHSKKRENKKIKKKKLKFFISILKDVKIGIVVFPIITVQKLFKKCLPHRNKLYLLSRLQGLNKELKENFRDSMFDQILRIND